ncbi:MAG: hypothetical protein ACE5Q4_02725 [Nitrosopumilus sp.]|jgi:hypothetical protein
MTTIELNSNEYSEGVKFPKTRMGEESVVDVTIKNPYETRIHIEAVPKDPDLHVLFCPEYLEGNDSAVIKLKYAPTRTRTESLNGKEIHFEIAL